MSQPISAEQVWKWHVELSPHKLYPGVTSFVMLPPFIKASYYGIALGIARHTELPFPAPPEDVPADLIKRVAEAAGAPVPELPDTPPRT